MTLEEILAKAISRKKIIEPKVFGLGGYKATRYTFENGTTLEVGQGRDSISMPHGFKARTQSVDINEVILRRGKEVRRFRAPVHIAFLEEIEEIVTKTS
jgi:hypothetical protein